MSGPMSAIARRKAAQKPSRNVVHSTRTPPVQEPQSDGNREPAATPTKKRKRGTHHKQPSPVPPASEEDSEIRNASSWPSNGDLESRDTSDIEGDMEDDTSTLDDSEVHDTPTLQLSKFSDKRSAVLKDTDRVWTIRLHPNDNLAILGQYDLWVRSGAVSLLGAVIHASSKLHRLLNSADDPYLRPLRSLKISPKWQDTITRLASSDFDNMSAMVCGPKGAGKSTFGRTLANALLATASRNHDKTEDYSVALLDLDPGQPEYSPPGEMSLQMMRSYNLGPPFTHPVSIDGNDLIKAHHLGHLSPKEDPVHYYECVLDLFNSYKALSVRKRLCPLIVNCSGWIQGTGLDLMVDMVRDLELSDVIYMSTEGPEDVVGTLTEAAKKSNTPLHQLTSQTSDVITRTAADLRMMQTLSYFHLDEPERGNLRWKAKPLTSFPPTIVHYTGPKQGIAAIVVLGDEQSPEFMESILEGCVVGIVAIDEDLIRDEEMSSTPEYLNGQEVEMDVMDSVHASTESDEFRTAISDKGTQHTIRRTPTGIPYLAPQNHTTPPLPPSRSHSLGQALIRGIDTHHKTFHLLTPISPSTITHHTQEKHQKIVLVRGKLDTPTWAYAEDFEYEKTRRRQREKVLGEKEEFGAGSVRAWAEGQPWAGVVEGGRRGSGKVKKVRRDIRYRGQVRRGEGAQR